MPSKFIVAAVALVFAGPAMAGGHGGGDPSVKARQSHMRLFQHNVSLLGAMAKGEMDYDAEQAQAAADNLVALANLAHVGYWTPGTSRDELGEETRALPGLWAEDSRAMEYVGQVREAAVELADVAGDGQEWIGPALGPVGQACGACHKAYRFSEN